MNYPYKLPQLHYAYDELAPHIDAQTMEIHHDKHHAAYIKKLNAALEGTDFADNPIHDILKNIEQIPEDIRKLTMDELRELDDFFYKEDPAK